MATITMDLGPLPDYAAAVRTLVGDHVTVEGSAAPGGKILRAWTRLSDQTRGEVHVMVEVELTKLGEALVLADVSTAAAATGPSSRSPTRAQSRPTRWRSGATHRATPRRLRWLRGHRPEGDPGAMNRDVLLGRLYDVNVQDPPVYTVTKYGGIYSMKRVTRGGFRTRYRVRWLRVLLRMLRPAALADGWRGLLEMETAAMDMEDYMRTCPHRPEWIHRDEGSHSAWCSVCMKAMPW